MSWVEITREPARTLLHPPKRYALSFDGEDDYVRVGKSLNDFGVSADGGYTVEVLVKILSYDGSQRGIVTTAYRSHGIWYRYDIRASAVENIDGTKNRQDAIIAMTTGVWLHLAETAKAYNFVKLYKNGELGASKDLTGYFDDKHLSFDVGRFADENYYGNVEIAYVRIYNRALSDTEIQHNYLNPMNPILDGCVMWLAMEEGSGTTVYDKSGNGNDGTIVGARWIEVTRLPTR